MEYINYYLTQINLIIHSNPYLMMYLSIVTFIYFTSILIYNLVNMVKVEKNQSNLPVFSILFCSFLFPVIILFLVLLSTVFKENIKKNIKVVKYKDDL